MKNFLIVLFILISAAAYPQSKLDNLLNDLKTARHDTAVYNAYIELGSYFQSTNPDTAIYFHSMAEQTAQKIPGIEGELRIGVARNEKGWNYYVKSDYTKARELYESALKIAESCLKSKNQTIVYKAKKMVASSIGNIGLIHYEQGNYSKTLEYYFKALSIFEYIGNKQRQASILGNIGIVFYEQGNYSKALEYYFKALTINEEIGRKEGQANNLGNIGIVFYKKGNYSKALEYYNESLRINKEIGNKRGQANILGNIGNIFYEQAKYTKALEYYFQALKIDKLIGNKRGQAANLVNIGESYTEIGQLAKAEEYLKKAEALNKELGTIYYLRPNYQNLSELYEKQNKHKEALFYYKEYAKAHDSLNSEQNRKALQTQELKYQYEKEQALKDAEHQKQLEIQRKEKEQQQVVSYAIGGGLFLVIIFSVFIFNRLQVTRRQKQVIETQKKLVEEKNKEITDSITYAKRIQDAILPSDEKWKELLPDSFIYYLPKDIVAGDFYWLEETDDYIFIAAADCTGHGVPGAMVSVVCSNALTKTVIEEKITETGRILDRTRELVIERFAKSSDDVKDGMDISLCAIDFKNMKLQWSGANNPLWIINPSRKSWPENSLPFGEAWGGAEYKPNKQPIGKVENPKPFTAHTIELQKGDTIYLFTDGFQDQFGGEKGKKLGRKNVKELLIQNAALSCHQQKNVIENFFCEWKKGVEQVDDVTFIGIKI